VSLTGEEIMPNKRVPGRDRVDLKADPKWVATVAQAAQSVGLNLSSYIRLAVAERLQRDGFTLPAELGTPAEEQPAKKPKRRRGRPTQRP
jgi:hypothetical protein